MSWVGVRVQRKVGTAYPSTMSSPYLTGTLVEAVEMFSCSGENMCPAEEVKGEGQGGRRWRRKRGRAVGGRPESVPPCYENVRTPRRSLSYARACCYVMLPASVSHTLCREKKQREIHISLMLYGKHKRKHTHGICCTRVQPEAVAELEINVQPAPGGSSTESPAASLVVLMSEEHFHQLIN